MKHQGGWLGSDSCKFVEPKFRRTMHPIYRHSIRFATADQLHYGFAEFLELLSILLMSQFKRFAFLLHIFNCLMLYIYATSQATLKFLVPDLPLSFVICVSAIASTETSWWLLLLVAIGDSPESLASDSGTITRIQKYFWLASRLSSHRF